MAIPGKGQALSMRDWHRCCRYGAEGMVPRPLLVDACQRGLRPALPILPPCLIFCSNAYHPLESFSHCNISLCWQRFLTIVFTDGYTVPRTAPGI